MVDNGKWDTVWGAQRAYSRLPLNQFWAAAFFVINYPLFETNDPNDPKEKLEVQKKLGDAIYKNCLWQEYDNPIFDVEVDRE